MKDEEIKFLIKKIWNQKLLRDPDNNEFKHYFHVIKNGELKPESLSLVLESSEEFSSLSDFKNGFTITNHGFGIFLDPKDQVISRYIAIKKEWEQNETNFLKTIIHEGMIVVDIGANIGYFSLLLSNLIGSTGKVFSFEPNPRSFNFLKKNTEQNKIKNIKIFQNAVGNKDRMTKLFLSKINFGDNRISPTLIEDTDAEREIIDVKMVTLDNILQNETIDFLKVDSQGAEMKILEGAKKTLEKNKKIKMFLEFWPIGLKSQGCEPLNFLSKIHSLGFKIYDLEVDISNEILIEELCAKYTEKLYTNLYCIRE